MYEPAPTPRREHHGLGTDEKGELILVAARWVGEFVRDKVSRAHFAREPADRGRVTGVGLILLN